MVSLDTSNSTFGFYYLEPTSYEEGKVEIVDYYRMFTIEQYKQLYVRFGGHARHYMYFYGEVYCLIKLWKI